MYKKILTLFALQLCYKLGYGGYIDYDYETVDEGIMATYSEEGQWTTDYEYEEEPEI